VSAHGDRPRVRGPHGRDSTETSTAKPLDFSRTADGLADALDQGPILAGGAVAL